MNTFTVICNFSCTIKLQKENKDWMKPSVFLLLAFWGCAPPSCCLGSISLTGGCKAQTIHPRLLSLFACTVFTLISRRVSNVFQLLINKRPSGYKWMSSVYTVPVCPILNISFTNDHVMFQVATTAWLDGASSCSLDISKVQWPLSRLTCTLYTIHNV